MAKSETASQGEIVKGKRGTKVHVDYARDNSSMDLPTTHGKALSGKGDLSHSLDGTSVASES